MSKAITYRRLSRAALNTAEHTDGSTAAMLRLMAADYAAEADRLEEIEHSNGAAPAIDALAPSPEQNLSERNER